MEVQLRCKLCKDIARAPVILLDSVTCKVCEEKCVFCLDRPGILRPQYILGRKHRHLTCDSPECLAKRQGAIEADIVYLLNSRTAGTQSPVRNHSDCHCGKPGDKLECGKFRCDDHDDCTCYECSH